MLTVICETCGGSGKVHSHNPKCWDCAGQGSVKVERCKHGRDAACLACAVALQDAAREAAADRGGPLLAESSDEGYKLRLAAASRCDDPELWAVGARLLEANKGNVFHAKPAALAQAAREEFVARGWRVPGDGAPEDKEVEGALAEIIARYAATKSPAFIAWEIRRHFNVTAKDT